MYIVSGGQLYEDDVWYLILTDKCVDFLFLEYFTIKGQGCEEIENL